MATPKARRRRKTILMRDSPILAKRETSAMISSPPFEAGLALPRTLGFREIRVFCRLLLGRQVVLVCGMRSACLSMSQFWRSNV